MNATTKPSERVRGEGELYKGVWTFQSAKRTSPTPCMEYIYSPFPLLAVMGKTRTSRTIRYALADCPHLNSKGKKHEVNGCQEWPLGQADCPPGSRGLSVWAPRTVHE
jgi:hypothetical protein